MADYTQPEANPWTPAVQSDQTLEDATLADWVYQALGAASMCWHPRPEGVFDSRAAKHIGDGLHGHIQRVIDGVIEGTRKESERLYYDEQTMMKVRHAIHNVLGGNINDERITDIINEAQALGLLFRERAQ